LFPPEKDNYQIVLEYPEPMGGLNVYENKELS
jgi:hypothetical protein